MDTSRNPLFHTAMVSVGVNAPGNTTTPCFRANSVHADRPVEMRIGDTIVTSVRLTGASLLPHIDDLRSVTDGRGSRGRGDHAEGFGRRRAHRYRFGTVA
jgi:hypothetical protein